MRTFFLHTCKRILACAFVLSLFNVTPFLLCWQERTNENYSNCKEMNDEQRQKLQLLLNTVGTRAIREDFRAPRPDAPSYPGSEPSSVVSPFDDATLRLIQECLCIVKNCVQQIKKGIILEPTEEWASLIDKIACSMIDNPDLPTNLAEGETLLAEALAAVLCRIGCPITPGTIFEFLNLIFMKTCTIDSKVDVIDEEVGTILSKICTIDSKIDVIDAEVDTIFSKICTIDSKIDVIDDEVEFAISKLCTIDSKIDELFIDFQETWTILGANADPVPTPNAVLDVNATTTYTVLQWLKAIYHKVK